MSNPTSAALTLQVFGGNLNRSDISEAMVVALLEVMDVNGIPEFSSTPVADCIAYVESTCSHSVATTVFAQKLNSKRNQEAQGQ